MKKKKKTLISRFILHAGLGNQMFEWAAGYAMAKKLGRDFECVWEPTDRRDFGLGEFGITPLPFDPAMVPICRHGGQGNADITAKIASLVSKHPNEPVVIKSPFQAEECFAGVEDEIREKFKLDPLELDIPEGMTPVGLQVRRGDYLKLKHLGVTHLGYFMEAMDIIRSRVDKPHFFIISDDPDWCRDRFSRFPDTTVMPPQSPHDALRTMVACEAHIISNSTLGWWGAWLGEKGPVVAPDPWHGGGGGYGDWRPVPDRWLTASTRKRETFIPGPPPETDRAIVWPWKQESARWHELRYSMRSVDRFFEDKDCPVYIVGNRRPGWIRFGGRVNFIDRWSYAEALLTGVQLAKKVLWMNDDIVLLKPVTWADVETPRHMGEVSSGLVHRMTGTANTWRDGMIRALGDLKTLDAVDKPLLFSTHLPYVYDRDKAIAVLQRYGFWNKMPLEMIYGNLHWGNAVPIGDTKTQQIPFAESMFLNHTDKNLTPELKEAIKALLPDKSPYEVGEPVGA